MLLEPSDPSFPSVPGAGNLFMTGSAKAPAIIRIQASPAVRDGFYMVNFHPWIPAKLADPFIPPQSIGYWI